MKRILTTILILSAASAMADPAVFTGVISVDSIEAMPGEQFPIAIRLNNNDISIAGMVIPLRLDNPMLTLDSVSFVGSVKPPNMVGVWFSDPATDILRVSYLPDVSSFPIATFNTPGGIIANLWMTASLQAQPGSIVIDSVNEVIQINDSVQLWTRIEVIDSSGINFFLPEFLSGEVLVRVPTAVDDDPANLLPTSLELGQNYPNPFNPSTIISYSLPRSGPVELRVYNVLGQEVADLVNGFAEAGRYEVTFDATRLPSGVYFYRLSYDGTAETKKMMLVK